MFRSTNPFSAGTAADGIGFTATSVPVRVEEVIVGGVACPIEERSSLVVPAWEIDQHTLTLIARPIPTDHLMIRACDMPFTITTHRSPIQAAIPYRGVRMRRH
jgi:hypothetical protein